MDKSLEFLLYSGAVYLAAALLGSWYFTRPTAKVKGKKPKDRSKTEPKPVVRRKTYLKPGFVGYCTYCARFLLDDDYVEKHVQGKKHREKAAGATTWLELRRPGEIREEPKAPPPPPPVENPGTIAAKKHKQKMTSDPDGTFQIAGKQAKRKSK
mmetsp:Transcript_34417/g.60334  ORF Transcript_34417/g.60334 Transcript_34417/m.60334 type:complete len:154 (-) Transcript_34417:5707-6168(-)